MSQQILDLVEKSSLKTEVPDFSIGDTVDVHTKILEGDKERIQIFTGVVIARSGSGSREMFTVRRIVANEGVERKFPLHSPKIEKIDVVRSGVVRRAKLYFLRDRVGKAVRLKETPPRRQRRAMKFRVMDACVLLARPADELRRVAKKSLGQRGEDAAAKFLKRKGYRILARHVDSRLGELDIIAVDGRTVVFVEVKTRTYDDAGHPAEAIDARKQQPHDAGRAGVSQSASAC